MQSESQAEQKNSSNGRWNIQEHIRFLAGIMKHGKDWKLVQSIVKTRTGSQVRSHAQKFFLKLQKIQKQRRKQRNKHKQQKTQTEKEILKYISLEQITDNTPAEIITLLRSEQSGKKQIKSTGIIKIFEKEQQEVPANLPQNEQSLDQKEKNSIKKQYSDFKKQQSQQQMIKQLLNVYHNIHEDDEDQEDSFLLCVLQYWINAAKGRDFTSLIDFGKEKVTALEQGNQSESESHSHKRKRSFTIPGGEENESKLLETLETIRKVLKRE